MQRYISKELIHFIGKNLNSDSERYNLFKKILTAGCISASAGKGQNPTITIKKNVEYFRKIESTCICFCDIPVNDLPLHMNKYSNFGISFRKSFLIAKGVNPVFYFIIDQLEAGAGMRTNKCIIFNEIIDIGEKIFEKFKIDETSFEADITNEVGDSLGKTRMTFKEWYEDLVDYIFSHIKPFKNANQAHSKENFYMEREWRSLSDIKFLIGNVYRVILPEQFVKKFCSDFSDKFIGQISFSEDFFSL